MVAMTTEVGVIEVIEEGVVLLHPLHQGSLNIQVSDALGVGLDKGFTGRSFSTHQDIQYSVNPGGIIYTCSQEDMAGRISASFLIVARSLGVTMGKGMAKKSKYKLILFTSLKADGGNN